MIEVAIIVPVMRRPKNVQPFVKSLIDSISIKTIRVYAVFDEGDWGTANAWAKMGATLISINDHRDLTRPGRFSEKANVGYECSNASWIFLVGDDVRFHPGWFEEAKLAAGDRYHVVGVNDLGDLRVTAGLHAPHFLIRRSYIRQVGVSWDGPGVVAHEGYYHWYVDDEIVTASKQRGVWTMALDSVVEHMHPFFNKGDMDDVYEAGIAYKDRDRVLFNERLERFSG